MEFSFVPVDDLWAIYCLGLTAFPIGSLWASRAMGIFEKRLLRPSRSRSPLSLLGAALSSSTMSSSFVGTWKLVSSEHFDAYMRALGKEALFSSAVKAPVENAV